MMRSRRTRLLTALGILVPSLLLLALPAAAQEPVTSRFKLSIGGYIKAEAMYRTNNGGIGFAGSIPGTQNFGFAVVPQHNTVAGTNGQFDMFANESRFQFTINAPDWRGLKPLGYLEMDFDGDSPSTIERFCPSQTPGLTQGVGSPCAFGQASGNPRGGGIQNGGFRIRHAFMRLSGEGLGGSWSLTFGQTWNTFGLLPFYGGSSLSFGGATIFGGRSPQLTFRHDLRLFRDFTWQNTFTVSNDTTGFNEMPILSASARWIYAGWQGFQGGARTPLNVGISTMLQRQKADLYEPTRASAVPGTASIGPRSLSATAWGLTGGIFLPILPGRSATDRTFALSVISEAGYGEGVNTQVPGTNPMPLILSIVQPGAGASNRADIGASFFRPSSCTAYAGPVPAAGLTVIGTAALGTLCPAGFIPSELSLIKTPWLSYNVQFYLPFNFWLSGGQKWIWYPNADNAGAQTCLNVPGLTCGAGGTGLTHLAIPAYNQGRFNRATGLALNNTSNLLSGRDATIKRQHYNYISAFYDMTPNIRLGLEWGMHGTNRKDSDQDNQSHRWQFGAYYFF